MSLIRKYTDRVIFSSFALSTEALGLYRIFYSCYLLIFGIPVVLWLDNFPSAFYNPPLLSLSGLFSNFPGFPFLLFISFLTCLLPVLLLFGYKTRLVSILLAFCILFEKSFAYSLGKIDHDFLMWMVPLILAFSNWGMAFSLDARYSQKDSSRSAQSWPVTLLALVLCLGMFSAGFPKLMGGWLDFSTQAVRGHFLREFYFNERQELLAPLLLSLDSPLLWEVLDYAGVLLECLFLFALVKPNLFRGFVLLAILFHVLNYLLLNISFSDNYILYMLFIDWKAVVPYLREKRVLARVKKSVSFRSISLLIGLQAFFFIFYLSTGYTALTLSPSKYLFEQVWDFSSLFLNGLIIVGGLLIALVNAVNFFRRKNFTPKLETTKST